MKFRILASSLLLVVAQTAMAATAQDPFPCPTVRALKDVGVSTAIILKDGPTKEWAGVEQNNEYYTQVPWTFVIQIDGMKGKPKNEILAAANTAISSLILEGGPYRGGPGDPDIYFCRYYSTSGAAVFAAAITPPQDLSKALATVRK